MALLNNDVVSPHKGVQYLPIYNKSYHFLCSRCFISLIIVRQSVQEPAGVDILCTDRHFPCSMHPTSGAEAIFFHTSTVQNGTNARHVRSHIAKSVRETYGGNSAVYSAMDADNNCSNGTQVAYNPDFPRGVTLSVIWVLAIVGNILTLAIVLRYRLRKVPDLLVFGLACTDLVACAFPIPTSLWSYYSGREIDGTEHLMRLCSAFTVVAKFTRDSSIFMVTLMVVDRFVWVLRPIQYNQGLYHKFFCVSLPAAWLLALILSLLTLVPGVDNEAGGNICLFAFQNWYGITVIVYGLIQFIVVLVCFVIVIVEVLKLAGRRRKMLVRGNTGANHSLSCNTLTKLEAVTTVQLSEKVENGEHVSQRASPVESNVREIGCLKRLKKQLKCICDKVHPSAEQQFAIMFSAIIILFYISWLPIVVSHNSFIH